MEIKEYMNLQPNDQIISIKCQCGQESQSNILDLRYWKMQVIGTIQFRCLKCGRVHNYMTTGEIWETKLKDDDE